MDVILILTKDSYYIAHYDDEVDKVTNYQRVAFEDLELIELGPLDQSAFNLPFKSSSNRSQQFCLRIHFRLPQPPSAIKFNGESLRLCTVATLLHFNTVKTVYMTTLYTIHVVSRQFNYIKTV